MFPMFFGQTNRVKKSLQACYLLDPIDFETDGEDELMDWYLFDQSVDEEPVADDVVDDAVPSNSQALIIVAIQIIEHAEQVRQGVTVTPDLMGFLPKTSEDDAWSPDLHTDAAEPGSRRDRGKVDGPSCRLLTSSTQACMGPSYGPPVIDISKEVGVPMLVANVQMKGIDACNRSLEKMFANMEVPSWIAFTHVAVPSSYHGIDCKTHVQTLYATGGPHLRARAAQFEMWWTTQTAIIKASTSKWIWQFEEPLLQHEKPNQRLMPLHTFWFWLRNLWHKLNAMFFVLPCTA